MIYGHTHTRMSENGEFYKLQHAHTDRKETIEGEPQEYIEEFI